MRLARHPLRSLLVSLALVVPLAMVATPPSQAHRGHDHGGADVVAVTQVADRQVDLTLRSEALGGREVGVRLLTPDGWDPGDRRQHWPTLWLLHGCCDSYVSWTRSTDVADIEALREVLVVMPEGGVNGWYSNWWNQGEYGSPAWETFHTRELPALLRRDFGASGNATIAGLSMGGQGALEYAARHRGMFRAAASFSGSVHPLLSDESTERILGFFALEGNDPTNVWGDPVEQRRIWEAHDPYYLARGLAQIPVFLSSGNGEAGPFDPPGTYSELEADFGRQNMALARRLERLHARHLTTDFYGPGQHGWAYWERELHRSLPILLRAMHVGSGHGHHA